MAQRSLTKGIVRDIIIIVIGIVVIGISLQVVFGTPNPFYVVASGSMVPELEKYDILIVQGRIPIEEIEIGDIIVFNRPSDHERVIVHRVVSIMEDDPRTLRAKGDANSASIPGTDFPITEKDYIGIVLYVIPEIGIITQVLKPPVNYIIIVIVLVVMIGRQVYKKSKDKSDHTPEDLPDLNKIEKDVEYSSHNDSKQNDSKSNTDSEKPKK